MNILNRLPKVTFNTSQLLIDGNPLPDSLFQVVSDIMRNDIKGVENVIQKLRTSDDDWDVPFDSFSNTLRGYLQKDGSLEELKTENKSSFATPMASTPIKVNDKPNTRSKRIKRQTSPEISSENKLDQSKVSKELNKTKKKKKNPKKQYGKGGQVQFKGWQSY